MTYQISRRSRCGGRLAAAFGRKRGFGAALAALGGRGRLCGPVRFPATGIQVRPKIEIDTDSDTNTTFYWSQMNEI